MSKKDIISKIKTIIEKCGTFSTADVEATSSPVVATIGKNTSQLAERFNNSGVNAVTYVHETETDSESIKYEDLTTDTLSDILELAKEWEEMCVEA